LEDKKKRKKRKRKSIFSSQPYKLDSYHQRIPPPKTKLFFLDNVGNFTKVEISLSFLSSSLAIQSFCHLLHSNTGKYQKYNKRIKGGQITQDPSE